MWSMNLINSKAPALGEERVSTMLPVLRRGTTSLDCPND